MESRFKKNPQVEEGETRREGGGERERQGEGKMERKFSLSPCLLVSLSPYLPFPIPFLRLFDLAYLAAQKTLAFTVTNAFLCCEKFESISRKEISP